MKPVVVAIVVEAVFKIGGRALKRRVHLGIAAAAFVAAFAAGAFATGAALWWFNAIRDSATPSTPAGSNQGEWRYLDMLRSSGC